jgi:hypothetical protein
MAKELSDLQAKLKKADPIVQRFVAELEKRNSKLQLQMVKLEADKVEAKNRVKALEEQWKGKKADFTLNLAPQTPEEVKARLRSLLPSVISALEEEGYKVIPPAR